MSLANKQRALITGASSGIGKATTLAFAKAGIDLALVSRTPSKLEAVVAEVSSLGVEAKAYPVDLADVNPLKDRMSAIAAEFGPIDILVNNAGIGYTGTLMETPLADWQSVLNINLTSVFQCIQGVIPGMRDRASGTIINIASIAAQNPFPNWGAYSVSKAGLVALSKTLAAEERSHGIRVICISPGAVNTPIWDTDTVQADFNRNSMLTPESVAQTILHTALLPASAVVEELTLLSNAGVL